MKQHDKVTIAGIVAVLVFGLGYLYVVGEPSATVLLSIIAAMAGLGGYNLQKRRVEG